MAVVREQTYELVDIGDLSPHPDNPRLGDVDLIAASVDAHGFYGAIVAQRSTGHVLAGNHRLLAAKRRGIAAVPVVWVDVDDDRAKRILLADNRTGDVAGYDEDSLAALLKGLSLSGEGLAGTGYTEDDLAELAGRDEAEGLTHPDDAPSAPAEPVSKLGDVWLLGEHRLLVGDACDQGLVAAMLDGTPCDGMWTDPPYGVDYVGKTKDALTIKGDEKEDLAGLLAGFLDVADNALKAGTPFYVAHADTARMVVEEAVRNTDWSPRQNLVWVKDVMVLGRSDYHWRHEPILYGFTPGGDGRRGRGGDRWYGGNNATTVLEFPKPSASRQHPTMKPVDLIAACLANSCPPGGLVYDPFAGSGSTLIAAHRLGLKARLVELDPAYADVICRRYQEHTGTLPVSAATGEPHDFAA